MLTYILLFSLITLVILGVVRASKQNQSGMRLQKEPFVGVAQRELADEIETVGKPRIISQNEVQPTFTMSVKDFGTDTDSDFDAEDVEDVPDVPELPDTDAPPLFAAKPVRAIQNDVIVIHIFADASHPYQGYELLQAILTAGLRYGKWNIFHRHEEMTGRGPILFSLTSSTEPGTFDLAKMGGFSTPGLTLFMRPSNVEDPPQTFEKLLATAKQLVAELGGTICDEKRLPLSSEKVMEWQSILEGAVV